MAGYSQERIIQLYDMPNLLLIQIFIFICQQPNDRKYQHYGRPPLPPAATGGTIKEPSHQRDVDNRPAWMLKRNEEESADIPPDSLLCLHIRIHRIGAAIIASSGYFKMKCHSTNLN